MFGDRRNFGLRLFQGHARLEPGITFDPGCAPIVELVSARIEYLLHGGGHPELHGETDKGAMEPLGGNTDDGVLHAIEHLYLPHDCRVAAESFRPQPVTNHGHRMGIAVHVLAFLESTAEDWMNADGIEIIGGDDAGRDAFGTVADAK